MCQSNQSGLVPALGGADSLTEMTGNKQIVSEVDEYVDRHHQCTYHSLALSLTGIIHWYKIYHLSLSRLGFYLPSLFFR